LSYNYSIIEYLAIADQQEDTMDALLALPNELWQIVLAYILTPTHPVEVGSWEGSKPVLRFHDADADVEISLALLTGTNADEFIFAVSIPDIWRQFISLATWSFKQYPRDVTDVLIKYVEHRGKNPWRNDLKMLQTIFKAQIKHVEVIADQHQYHKLWDQGVD
jgi:hypothetical protein